ncbi:MAG: cytochrome ubiquinol oxidase subunit I [Acidobacteria bacterium]|nr:cytochrome ubiquinol oxidase subunit I [Acidobacteriota bacterium]
MNYPFWDVPIIGSGWVLGGIAIFHVMVSHFAVGGGLYLPLAERKARLEGRDDWLEVLKKHSKFFLVLTGVFGAVTGVAIWFSIGLANPEATSTLIHNFVFGWAIEYVFFLVELTTAAIYYYTWDKISPGLHLKIGYLYAATSWLTLVIINGILTFMLTPGATWLGVAGSGSEASVFWYAFFNPTYFPSLILRTLVAVSLAAVWALVTTSRIDGFTQGKLKTSIVRWSVKWLIPSFLLMPVAFAWYLYMVPESGRQLMNLGISTIGAGTFTHVTRAILVSVMASATIAALAYFVAYRNPRTFKTGWALSVLFLAFAATAATEQAREMLRKPFVIGQFMYSNGIRKSEVEKFNREGYLTHTMWLSPETPDSPYRKVGGLPEADRTLLKGELMFRGQCASCHTRDGYRALGSLLRDRDEKSIRNIVQTLHEYKEDSPYRAFMPPLVGKEDEIEALVQYLRTLNAAPPKPEAPATQTARVDR